MQVLLAETPPLCEASPYDFCIADNFTRRLMPRHISDDIPCYCNCMTRDMGLAPTRNVQGLEKRCEAGRENSLQPTHNDPFVLRDAFGVIAASNQVQKN